MKDIDGNTYNIFTIGNTDWLLENLKTSRFANGDSIPSSESTVNSNPKIMKWAPAGDKERIKNQGYLYSWSAVIDTRGICPTGWKVPSDDEWKILVDTLFNNSNSIPVTTTENSNYTYKKKTNKQAIPFVSEMDYAGSRMQNGNYIFQESFAYYWTNTMDYQGYAWMWYFSPTTVNHYNYEINGGLSVRCMRTNLK